MAFIEISNLNTADGFLTELEKTDTVQIFGGRNRGSSSSHSIVSTPPPSPNARCCKCPATIPPVIIPPVDSVLSRRGSR
jgi:hypothetical protein